MLMHSYHLIRLSPVFITKCCLKIGLFDLSRLIRGRFNLPFYRNWTHPLSTRFIVAKILYFLWTHVQKMGLQRQEFRYGFHCINLNCLFWFRDLRYNNIRELKREDFKNLKNLENLWVVCNLFSLANDTTNISLCLGHFWGICLLGKYLGIMRWDFVDDTSLSDKLS